MRAIPAHRRRTPPSFAAAILLLSCVLSTPAHAEIVFRGPSSLYPTLGGPSSVAIADLDRDGHSDLVVVNIAIHTVERISYVSILRGRGDGTFEPKRDIRVGSTPQAVVAEDLDGDGRRDLAVTTYGLAPSFPSSVEVLLGNGDGTFKAGTFYAAGYSLHSLSAVDLDADGDLDLVTENSVLLGNGDGTFGPPAIFGVPSDWYTVVGDLNRDGHPDLVSSNFQTESMADDSGEHAFTVRLGNGDGTFQGPALHGLGFRCHGLAVAELDGDGAPDLVVSNTGEDTGEFSGVNVFPGRGDGTFGAGRFLTTGLNPRAVTIADLNGDGSLDLVTANDGSDPRAFSNSLSILLGDGKGDFRRLADLPSGEDPIYVAVGRLDGDDIPDLVSVNAGEASVSVYLGNGDGTFGTPDRELARRPVGLVASDFDMDGRADLALTDIGTAGGPCGGAILGRGDGTFSDLVEFPGTTSRHFVGTVDLDDDPPPDLVFIVGTGVAAMLGNGDGTFRESFERSLLPTQTPGIPAFADFDRDGRMDLAVPLNYEADAVSILLGREGGSFGETRSEPTAHYPQSAAAGDLNADGTPDLVLAHDNGVVSVKLGRGDGTFAPHVLHDARTFFSGAGPIALVDIDSDGRLDVVGGKVVWMGNGDGTLRQGTSLTFGGDEVRGTVAEDLDRDGRVDLVLLVVSDHSSRLTIHPGRGDGTFGPRVDFGTGSRPRALTAGDFDGDGRSDLAVSNMGSSSISFYLNHSEAPVLVARLDLLSGLSDPRAVGRWVTGVIELPAPHSARAIDIGSIRLNGSVPVDASAPRSFADQDRDGVEELVVRFDRATVMRTLSRGANVPVTVTGEVDGRHFEGTDVLRVPGRGIPGRAIGAARLAVLQPQAVQAGPLKVEVTLPDDSPARLELLDVAGRVVQRRDLGALGRGSHPIEVREDRRLTSGIYFVRLLQGTEEAIARAVLLR